MMIRRNDAVGSYPLPPFSVADVPSTDYFIDTLGRNIYYTEGCGDNPYQRQIYASQLYFDKDHKNPVKEAEITSLRTGRIYGTFLSGRVGYWEFIGSRAEAPRVLICLKAKERRGLVTPIDVSTKKNNDEA